MLLVIMGILLDTILATRPIMQVLVRHFGRQDSVILDMAVVIMDVVLDIITTVVGTIVTVAGTIVMALDTITVVAFIEDGIDRWLNQQS